MQECPFCGTRLDSNTVERQRPGIDFDFVSVVSGLESVGGALKIPLERVADMKADAEFAQLVSDHVAAAAIEEGRQRVEAGIEDDTFDDLPF